jgi:hypothetical protein
MENRQGNDTFLIDSLMAKIALLEDELAGKESAILVLNSVIVECDGVHTS